MLQANHDPARQQLEEVFFFFLWLFFFFFLLSKTDASLMWMLMPPAMHKGFVVVKKLYKPGGKKSHNMTDFDVPEVKPPLSRVDAIFISYVTLCISYPRCDQCMPVLTHPLTSICATKQWLKWAWLVSAESPWQGYKYGLIRPTDGHPASHWVIRLYFTTRSELGC